MTVKRKCWRGCKYEGEMKVIKKVDGEGYFDLLAVCPKCGKVYYPNAFLVSDNDIDEVCGERGRMAVASGCNASRRGNLQGDTTPAKTRLHTPEKWAKKWEALK